MVSKVEQPLVKKHEEYREKRSGMVFEVLGVGICAENDSLDKLVVIYTGYAQLLVRTQKDFLLKFEQIS